MGVEARAAIVAMERRIVTASRSAAAISPATARSLADLYLDESWIAERLMDRAVLREAEPGRYYLDEEAWRALRRTRGGHLIIAAVIILSIGLGFLLVKAVRR